MLKIVGRTFIILIVAGLIGLGWYAFSTTSASQIMEPSDRPAEFSQTDEAAGSEISTAEVETTESQTSTAEVSEDMPARPEGGEMGFSLSRVSTGMAVSLGQIALVIGLVILFQKLINRFTPTNFKLMWFRR
ncbi:MAG: hypothetical protein KDI79_06880 [Anaerolineae bacterium]|nr:hypothetical protein [Anaerolineae bacterium]